jgi:hypothetical protein
MRNPVAVVKIVVKLVVKIVKLVAKLAVKLVAKLVVKLVVMHLSLLEADLCCASCVVRSHK